MTGDSPKMTKEGKSALLATALWYASESARKHRDDPDSAEWPPFWVVDAIMSALANERIPPPSPSPVSQFVECATCAAKPGSPTLCADCLDRRRVWLRARGAPPVEQRTADVIKRVYACKRCGAENQILHFDGERQIGCARCGIFTDAALKDRTRLDFGPPGLDASVGPGPFVGRREVYARGVAMLGDVEVIPGVELRVDEILEAVLPTVRACARDAIGEVRLAIATLDDRRPIMVHAQRLAQLTEGFIATRLPGRRYFVEVGNDREGWIQVCTSAPAAETAA